VHVPGPIQDDELVLNENRFGNDGPGATWTHQPGNDVNQMDEQDGEITHYATIVSISAGITRLGFFTDLFDKIGIRHTHVSFEDRQDLLGHRSGRITTHYSAPDLSRLLHAVDSICEQKRATVLRLAEGVYKNPGKIPAVSNAAKSSALVS